MEQPLLNSSCARVMFDGLYTSPRLDHPEGIAVDPIDGSIWCGGGDGQLFRITQDASAIELRAHHPGGFSMGVAISPERKVIWLDAIHRAIYSIPADGGEVTVIGKESLGGQTLYYPNAAAFALDGSLFVSDSHSGPELPDHEDGPGIFRIRESGESELWSRGPFSFANGIALSPSEDAVYVAESAAHRIVRIPILSSGAAGPPQMFVEGLDEVPDGLAFGPDGYLYVTSYYPARILRISPSGEVSVLLDDARGHILANPTNLAFDGSRLLVANIGRWHITEIDISSILRTESPAHA